MFIRWFPGHMNSARKEAAKTMEVIDAIARKRGCLLTRSGGGLDRDKAARILLSDYRNGTLGRTSLETPDRRSAAFLLHSHEP